MKGIPQIEQKGGSIQRIFEKQFEQNPCSPSSENFSQQGHCGGRKNWKSVDRNPMIRNRPCLPTPACWQEAAGGIDIMVEWNKENDDETPLEMMPRCSAVLPAAGLDPRTIPAGFGAPRESLTGFRKKMEKAKRSFSRPP